MLFFLTLFLLTWTEKLPFFDIVAESVAVLSTGGISVGATAQLSGLGKLIIIVVMLVGRVGVITFGMALMKRDEDELEKEQEHVKREDLAV